MHGFDNINVQMTPNPDYVFHEIQTLGYLRDMSNWTYPNWKFDFQPQNLFLPQCSPFQRTRLPIIYAKSVCPPTPESKFSGSIIHLLVVVGAPEWEDRSSWAKVLPAEGANYSLGNDVGVLATVNQIFFHLREKVWNSKSWENIQVAVAVRKKL